MRASLKRLNLNAKNEEVANVLGLSKGTIDATLFFTRKHYGIAAGEGRRTPPPPPVDVPPEAEN
jgi:hypothetical protein